MMKSLKDRLHESILDNPDDVMDKMDKSIIVAEYNAWLHRTATSRNIKITDKNVEFIDGEPVIEHPSSTIDIRELPPYKVILKNVDDIHASIGTNRFTQKAGVTLVQQMQALREIIEQSNGWEISEFRLKNVIHGEKTLNSDLTTALGGHIEIKHAIFYIGEATFKLPYIWSCKDLEIQCEGYGNVYMTGLPSGVKSLKITRK